MHWGVTYNYNLTKISTLQNKCLRIITRSKYNAPTNPLYVEVKTLKLNDITKLEMLKFIYDYQKSNLPASLLNLFQLNENIHDHNTRATRDPHVTRYNYKMVGNSFLHKSLEYWFSLSAEIRNSPSRHSFSKNVKKSIIASY